MPPKRKAEPTTESSDAAQSRRSGRSTKKVNYNENGDKPAPKRTKKTKEADGPAEAESAVSEEAPKDAVEAKEPAAEPEAKEEPAAAAAAEEEKEPAKEEPAAEEKDSKTLAVGELVPLDIKVKDETGKELEIKELVADKGIVVFLYPKASTPGCTRQACSFRDSFEAFEKLDYKVYGLSMDSPKAQTSFKEKQKLNYSLLCDPDQALIKPLGGSKAGNKITRSHFVIEKGGKLLLAAIGVKPEQSVKSALSFIEGASK